MICEGKQHYLGVYFRLDSRRASDSRNTMSFVKILYSNDKVFHHYWSLILISKVIHFKAKKTRFKEIRVNASETKVL